MLLYFHGYRSATRPDLALLLREPLLAVQYGLTYLGLPFATGTALDPLTVAQGTSIALCLVLLFTLGYLWRWRADAALLARCTPWLLLVGIALANAALTTLGRTKFGLTQALASRYVIFAVFLPIGLSFTCAGIYEHLRSSASHSVGANRIGVASVALGAALATLHLLAAFSVVPTWKDFSHAREASKALIETINVVNEPELVTRVVTALPLRNLVATLDRIGYLHPPLLTSNLISAISDPTAQPLEDVGQVEAGSIGHDLQVRLRGWAVLPVAHRAGGRGFTDL